MTSSKKGVHLDSNRRLPFVAGALFIITFIASTPATLLLYTPILDDAGDIVGAGADNRIALGSLPVMILIIVNIGTAVALFPVLVRQTEGLALGYVAALIVVAAVGLRLLPAIVGRRSRR